MWDAIFIALTIALVALAIAYTRACDKVGHELRDHRRTDSRRAGARIPAVRAAPPGEAVMTTLEILKIAVYFLLILAVAKPAGTYMARVFTRTKTWDVERAIYRLAGV